MPEIHSLLPSAAKAVEPVAAAQPPAGESGAQPTSSHSAVDAGGPSLHSAVPPPQPVSGLTTYRDEATGQLIVQIFHAATGQVIAQFPSENQLEKYQPQAAAGGRPNLDIDT